MASGSYASDETEMEIDQTDDAESGQTSPKRKRDNEGESQVKFDATTSTVSATSTPDTAEVAGSSHIDAEKTGNKGPITDDAKSGQTSPKRRRKDEVVSQVKFDATTSTVSATSTPDKAEVAGLSHTDAEKTGNKNRFKLRQVIIKNFVKFKEEQTLNFSHDGVYFLIGPNQTGKSSVFEAIRRCMSIYNQSSFSSVPNKKEDSIVVCKFKNETDTIYSFYIRKTNPNDQDIPDCDKGCVLLDDNGEVNEFGMDRVENREGALESQQLLSKAISKFPKSFSLHAFCNWVEFEKNAEERTNNTQAGGESKCEVMLGKYIDNIVCAFPMRGFGPLQWSKSSKIRNKNENYAEASERAEVIKWYLEKTTIEQLISAEDREREKDYYDFITNTENVEYVLKTDPRENKHEIMVRTSDNEHPHPILKQSEGFVEAKLCSILLAVSEFSTVILEDPGYGMHPQMVDRLCTIMHEKVKKYKVVIVTTHNSNFLKPWLMENIFYFSNELDKGFKVTSGTVFADNADLKSAIPSCVTMEQFANFCYAETIVFVEGVSDKLFLEALARFLRNADFNNHKLFSSLQIVSMGGAGKVRHFRKCCKILNKTYGFILDQDIWKRTKTTIENVINEEEKAELNTRLEQENPNDSKNENIVNADLRKLYDKEIEKHFFLWNFKNLEAVFFHGVDGNNDADTMAKGIVKELMDKQIKLSAKIRNILEKCFPKLLSISDDSLVSKIKKPKKFKIFLQGEENAEDRVKLIKYLLKNVERIKGAMDIQRLQDFLKTLVAKC